ncbi:hypothetical protein ABK040_015334 [Willaertia magna]
MTAGKNKRVVKGKKTKKTVDSFAKKEWFDCIAPAPFSKRKTDAFTKTPINKTAGTKLSTEALKGRVFEVPAAELMNDKEMGHQLVKLTVADAKHEGKRALCVFGGLRFSTDMLRSLVKKSHTLVTSRINVKSADGFAIRVFTLAVTKRRALQVKKTTYAHKSQVLKINAKTKDIINKTCSSSPINDFVEKVVTGTLGNEIQKACASVYPLQKVHICKIKVLKIPKEVGGAIAH